MKKEEIISQKSPPAIGPYSQAVKLGNFVFCSGQIGIDPKTGSMVYGGIIEQTKQVFANLKNVLSTAGANFDDVIKANVYLDDIDDFVSVNKVYETYFSKPYPARATVEVARLPMDALIEIECIAYIKKGDDRTGSSCQCDCC